MSALIEAIAEFLSGELVLGGRTLPVTWSGLIFAFVLPVVGVYLVIRIVVFFVKRLLGRSQLAEQSRARFLRWFRLAYRLLFAVAVVVLGANLFGDQIVESLGSVFSFLREPFYASGSTRISIVTLIFLIPIFYLASWAGSGIKRFMERSVLERLSLDASRSFSIANLFRYGTMALIIIIGLSIIGINLSSLAVLFGVLGIGLGFGLQSVVANFFAGLMIVISRPIKEGDRVQVGEYEGDVTQIRMLYSIINTITDETIVIPNRLIVDNTMHNQSYENPRIILMTPVQVSYRSNLDFVEEVLLEVGKGNEFRDPSRQPWVLFRSFDESGVTVTLALPIANAIQRHVARSSVMKDISRAFRARGIEIPFPQRDVHVKQWPADSVGGTQVPPQVAPPGRADDESDG